ncbi:aspartic proteinase-like protein 2 [Artemisia annua]|uniref:Aspartic proteinase-like protein 2 n=1 Tax=Artemisia annua TaxID=35608 RepID=A0A2U1KB56_ARTAN|nr:aspartic proteinase-like protein 2 [Artemisia annua]
MYIIPDSEIGFICRLYYAKVLLGSPPKEFLVHTDTSSDGLWVSCESCTGCSQTNIYYDVSVSSTSYLISCSDKLCSRAATTCTSDRQAQCNYTLHHSSGTNASGYYVSDVIYLNINGTSEAPPSVLFGIKYDINLESISVNGQTLTINQSILRQGRTRVDSGTTLAYLAKGAFLNLFDAITKAASDFVQPTIRDSIFGRFPGVSLSFADNASMHLRSHDYLVQQQSSGDTEVWCIGFIESTNQDTILGVGAYLVLKDKLIVYDLECQRIAWVNYDCYTMQNFFWDLHQKNFLYRPTPAVMAYGLAANHVPAVPKPTDRQAQCSYTLHHSSGTNASIYYVSDVIHLNINGTSEAPPSVLFGLYYAKFLLGSPPKEFLVQTDTGSDGLWNYYDESSPQQVI